jgi:rapamycin-insensitive companion of mTOR
MGYLRTLHKLSGPNPLSPPTSPSSSNVSSGPTDDELNRRRVDSMDRLIGLLRRHVRVRYDLNIPDVVQA